MASVKQILSGMKLLIVDDHKDITGFMKQYLIRKGCQVLSASDVNEAFSILKNNSFDAVICDVCLPYISGLSLLKTLKSRGEIMPIVMISGYANREVAVECLNSGAYDFLFKPFRLEMLEGVLEEIFHKIQRWHEHGLHREKTII